MAAAIARSTLDFADEGHQLETMNRAADIIRILNRVYPIAGS